MNFYNYIFYILLVFACVNTNAQNKDSLKTIIAGKGDGIYKILRDNNYPAKDYYNVFIDLNKEKIKEDNSLINGETYYLPKLKTEKQNTSKKQSIILINDSTKLKSNLLYTDTVIDNKLKGAIIYLISGHGGPDPGAIAVVDGFTISEDEYAYDICLRMAKIIEEYGGKAYMIINDPNDSIRDEKYLSLDYDEYCYGDLEIPRNQIERLKQRVDVINELYESNKAVKYQRIVEIHLDSRSEGSKVDVFFYHYEKSKAGKKCAEAIQKVFDEKYAKYQPNRGYGGTVSARNLYVIRKAVPVAVFIELGNIQNAQDRKRFLDPNNRQALANWITEGIIEDYKNN